MTAPPKLHMEQIQDVAIISPQGDLEARHETQLNHLLASLLNTNHRKVVLNFSDVDHVHYGLMARLTQTRRFFQQIDGDLFFAEATPYLKKIFQVAAVDLQRLVFDSIGEALLCFTDRPVREQAWH